MEAAHFAHPAPAARHGTAPAAPPQNAAPQSFEAALAGLRPYLLRFAQRRLRDTALVEDMVQETLLAAWQGEAGFANRASLRTWVTGILLRRIADHLRAQHRRPAEWDGEAAAAPEGSADGGVASNQAAEAIDWLDPQRSLENRQFLQELAEGMARLPQLAAQVVAMRLIDGLSNEEAARRLDLDPRHCAVLLHRARARLRDGLLQRWRAPGQGAPATAQGTAAQAVN